MASHICAIYMPSRVLFNAEVEKKNKLVDACLARHAHFTPLYSSVDGLAGTEATCIFKEDGMQTEYSVGQELCFKCWVGFLSDWLLSFEGICFVYLWLSQ